MDRRCSVRIRGRRRCQPVECHVQEAPAGAQVEEVADLDVSRLHDVDAMDVVLERDLRTVKTVDLRTLRQWRAAVVEPLLLCLRPVHQSSVVVCDQCCVRTPPPRIRRKKRSSSRSSAWFPAGSAIRWFVAVVLVLAVLPPRAMAAPAPKSPLTSQRETKWINPCGMKEVEQELEDLSAPAVTVGELMQHIVVQAKNALMHTEQLREDYVKHTFNVGFKQHHDSWKSASYDWLPRIPKELGIPVGDDHLQNQKLEEALKDTYRDLQKYAVGLEQVVWDEEADHGDYAEFFKAMEYKLRSVLCEVQDVMAQQGVLQHPDVNREIMGQELRELRTNVTYRHLRDWIILRDYMNGLEYVIQLFEHFQKRHTQAS